MNNVLPVAASCAETLITDTTKNVKSRGRSLLPEGLQGIIDAEVQKIVDKILYQTAKISYRAFKKTSGLIFF